MTYFTSLGLLRQLLVGMTIVCIFLRPKPGTNITLEGFDVITTLVVPAMVPVVLMVILFDVLMTKMRISDTTGEEKLKFKKILRVEIATVVILLLAWMPYFLAIGR